MRLNTNKMRIKKVSKKAPEWKRNRMIEQSMRVTIINKAFDLAESDGEAVATHMGKRYP